MHLRDRARTNVPSDVSDLDWLWNGIFNFDDHLRNKGKINCIIEFLRQDKFHENSDNYLGSNVNSQNFKICKSISEITVCLLKLLIFFVFCGVKFSRAS